MAYFGGSATEESASRFDARRIIFALMVGLLGLSCGYLILHPETFIPPTPERVVIKEVPYAPSTQRVMVARDTIWAGQRLTPELFIAETRSVEGLETKVITDFKDVDGAYSVGVIPGGSAILRENITAVAPANALTARIPPGYRAVTISVDAESGVEGWVRPGARVDVVWMTNQRGRQVVTTLLENVTIISAERSVVNTADEQGVNGAASAKPIPSHVSLLVTSQDAPKIQLAKSSGSLSLILRGDTDNVEVGTETVTIDRLLKGRDIESLDENQGMAHFDGKSFVVKGRNLVQSPTQSGQSGR